FFSSRRRHTRFSRDWSSDVCSSDLDTTAKSSSCLGKYLCSAGLLATLIFAGASHAAACDRPAFTSAIPDGRSASEEQMASAQQRSEERRVGKECGSRGWAERYKKEQ